MTIQWRDDRPPARPVDIDAVRQLGKVASARDLDELGEPYSAVHPHALGWAVLFVIISATISAAGLATLVVQAARHWVGLLQIGVAAAAITLIVLGIDWLYSATVRGSARVR
jgi:hypothetical protein